MYESFTGDYKKRTSDFIIIESEVLLFLSQVTQIRRLKHISSLSPTQKLDLSKYATQRTDILRIYHNPLLSNCHLS